MSRPKPLALIALAAIWLQRSPLICSAPKVLASVWQPLSARILVSLAVVSDGVTHALTGATTSISPISPSRNPADSQVGERFAWVFRTSGGKSESYAVDALPAGLRYAFTNGVGSIQGTPTAHGTHAIEIVGYERKDRGGGSTDPYVLRLQVRPEAGYGSYQRWAEARHLASSVSDPNADPDRDGSSNFLEYAFDFDPLKPAPARGPKKGFAPVTTPEIVQRTANALQVAYIRRREDAGSEVRYVLETSVDMDHWAPVTGDSAVTPLDADWDGVILEIRGLGRQAFLRLRVETADDS